MSSQAKQGAATGARVWRRRLFVAAAWVSVGVGAYCWGRHGTLPRATAEPPVGHAAVADRARAAQPPSENAGRVVAWIYGNVPITRQELGEYLIARHGKEKVKHLINRRIIMHAARQKGVEVTGAEVEAALKLDAGQFGVTPKDFADKILKRYDKTLYEWKEDVIRPRLLMEKMCRARVSVTNEDLAMAFEAHYGEKVDCKIIMWPASEEKLVLHEFWPKIRNDAEEFDRQAKMQISPSLAAVAGHVKPIGRHTTGDPDLEKVIFALKPGEVSHVLKTKEGLVVVKCLGRIKPDTTVSYEKRRADLQKEVFEKKVHLEIKKLFKELHAEAKPKDLLNPESNILQAARQELSNSAGAVAGDGKGTLPKLAPAPAPRPNPVPPPPIPDAPVPTPPKGK